MKSVSTILHMKAAHCKEWAVILFNTHLKSRALRIIGTIRAELIDYPDKRERNRRLVILFAFLFLSDYLMYCLHTDKNIFDIFPPLPSLDREKRVSVYLPGLDGASIIRERRLIPVYDRDEKTAMLLFELVVKGSLFENTSLTVPADLFVRKVWIHGPGEGKSKVCVFDLEPAELRPNIGVIKNSERLFKKALEKTVSANIPAVKTVLLLEKGIPGTAIWEL
ncbi:MAG: hypothetical protein A2176_13400 [Spirochaetes bacterium RBG_13_51_14]|nr:MAG: hypothetical protein A2176_13400 [Spirochaetes bacterium RBG_13_51_14]